MTLSKSSSPSSTSSPNKNKKRSTGATTAVSTSTSTAATNNYKNPNPSKKAKYSTTTTATTTTSNHDTKTNHKYASSKTSSTSASSSSVLRPRKNAEIVEQGKRLWNSLRCKNNTTSQIREYMKELFPLIQSKIMELTMQHDASRIVQAAIQFGNTSERQAIVQELCHHSNNNINHSTTATTTTTTSHKKHTFLDVCQSQYAHFVVLKLLKYCSQDPICLSLLIQSLKGNIMKLITHTNGCRIIEVLFQGNNNNSNSNSNSSSSSTPSTASPAVVIPKDKFAVLKQEIYGPHYALFAQDTLQQLVSLIRQQQQEQNGDKKSTKEITFVVPTLTLNVALLPEKKDITMDHVRNNIILKGIDKQLYGYYYFQEIMYEYIQVLKMDENYIAIRDLTTTTNITDETIHLLSSKYGVSVVCQFIAYSTVKERKRIMKSCKGYTKSALFHKDAYLVLIRLLQCIDDTVLLHKNILQELLNQTNAASLSSMTNTGSGTNVTNPSNSKNTNTHLSISKSKEIVHSVNGTDASSTSERPVLLDIALSDTASKFLFVMLIPTTTTTTITTEESTTSTTNHPPAVSASYTKIFNPDEIEVLNPFNPYILEKVSMMNESSSGDTSTNSTITTTKNGKMVQKVYTSKKDPEIRRNEILQYFHVPLLQQLCRTEESVMELLKSVPGSNVLYHLYVATIQTIMRNPTGGGHHNAVSKSPTTSYNNQFIELLNDMIRMICLVCRNNLTSESSSSSSSSLLTSSSNKKGDNDVSFKENVFEHAVGHRLIKNLIMYDASINVLTATTAMTIPSFTEYFVQEFASDFNSMMTYNRGAFILVALLQGSTVIRERVLNHLNVTQIVQATSGSKKETKTPTSTAGWHALQQEIKKTL